MTYYLTTTAFLFFFTSFAYVTDRRGQLTISLFLITVFAAFCGLRWYAGNDYGAYIDIFEMVPVITEFTFNSVSHIHGEIGYKLFNSVLKSMMFENYSALFFIAWLSLFLKFFFYAKLAENVFFCVCFYLALHFYRAEFIQVRMALALGVLSIALLYYFKRENYKFIFIVLVATSIHSISIVFLPLLIARKVKLKYLLAMAFLFPLVFSFVPLLKPLLGFVIQLLNSSLLTVLYNYAFNGAHGANVVIYNLTPLRHLLIVMLVISVYPTLKKLDDISIQIIKVYLAGIALTSVFMDVELIYARALFLFDIVEPLVLCIVIYMFRNIYVRAALFFMISLCVLFLMSRNATSNQSLHEYQTWLSLIL